MNSQHKKVFFGKYVFAISKEVYEPAADTFLLAHNLSIHEDENVLDMGTGCGILGVLAAEKARRIVAVDINPHAVACAQENAVFNSVEAKVDVRLGDLFNAIRTDERFDLMLFNAPYLPVERWEGKSWIEKAWAGGECGRMVIDRFIDRASEYLTENGRILLVQSTLSNVDETLKRFLRHKLCTRIICIEDLDFEKIALIEARKQCSGALASPLANDESGPLRTVPR